MKWIRYESEVQGEYIAPGLNMFEYMPSEIRLRVNIYSLDEEIQSEAYRKESNPLYLEFIGLDETNHDSLASFISRHGPLGINFKWEFNYKDQSPEVRPEDIPEKISVIQNEIKLMRQLVELRDLYIAPCTDKNILERELIKLAGILDNDDLLAIFGDKKVNAVLAEAIRSTCDEERFNKTQEVAKGKLTYTEFLLDGCAYGVCNVLNGRLKQTLVSTVYATGKRPKDNLFYGVVRPDCLLSAMYYMLYADITQGRMIKKCKNATCPEYFTTTDIRKQYHDRECANKQGQKNRMKSKQDENLKQGIIVRGPGRPKKSDT